MKKGEDGSKTCLCQREHFEMTLIGRWVVSVKVSVST